LFKLARQHDGPRLGLNLREVAEVRAGAGDQPADKRRRNRDSSCKSGSRSRAARRAAATFGKMTF
jgi:hypothetical protein